MKNEWDMFAGVRKQLVAGAPVVTVYLTSAAADIQPGHYGDALDEEGESYELGTEFIAAFQECIRAAKIPWSYSPTSRRWAFGPGLANQPARPALPGELNIDLSNEQVDLLFGSGEDGSIWPSS